MKRFAKFVSGAVLAIASVSASADSTVDFLVNAHVEGYGQMTFAPDEWAGTRHESKRLESLAITPLHPNMGNWPSCLNVQYMAHIAGIGDTGWINAPSTIGSQGQSRRIEGMAFKLSGTCKEQYTIEYKCHIQDWGDQPTANDGEFCGTRGQSRRLEAVMITIRQR
ncbi:hypothetical protein [Parachitinimonas caeni]|uniref:Uncharacterized protein n=1 Tax=Parachitinimonas caeni TaxID=3031301 RepID=A0ABT7E5W2_9NEIS|nr:hypothetical protein [Parachitinimonas caeni]MDK2126850.1 hypothetical protein [Parachitinimonas caeni]